MGRNLSLFHIERGDNNMIVKLPNAEIGNNFFAWLNSVQIASGCLQFCASFCLMSLLQVCLYVCQRHSTKLVVAFLDDAVVNNFQQRDHNIF